MIRERSLKVLSCISFLLILHFAVLPAFGAAAEKKVGHIGGKVFDVDGTTPLVGVQVRIVNVETGEARDTKSGKEGCYKFKNLPNGTYSVAVNHEGKDYLLPEKLTVAVADKEVAVTACLVLGEKDNLTLKEDCHFCKEAGFPPYGIWIISGGAAAVAAGVIISRGEEKSPSRP